MTAQSTGKRGTHLLGSPLGRIVADAWADHWAVVALNVSNMETAQGVVAAATEANAPVILQVSGGAIAYAGYGTLTSLAQSIARPAPVPVFVHLDHCSDVSMALKAIADGYDSVMFDGSRLAYEDNVRLTSYVAAEAAQRGVMSEGEIGVIGSWADMTIEEAAANRTSPRDARRFAADSAVDVLAPALGAVHGMPDDAVAVDPQWVASISRAAGRPLALHGSSGIQPACLRSLIASGVAKVNVSSKVSRALAAGIRSFWARDPEDLDLRRFMACGREAVAALALQYFEATRSLGKADRAWQLAWGASRTRVHPAIGRSNEGPVEGGKSC